MRNQAELRIGPQALGSGLLRTAASTTKYPFITKPRIGVTGRFLAVAVGEGRVEQGSFRRFVRNRTSV
jgi:hypothetical protein